MVSPLTYGRALLTLCALLSAFLVAEPSRAQRVMNELMKMRKLDIARLQNA